MNEASNSEIAFISVPALKNSHIMIRTRLLPFLPFYSYSVR